MNNTKQYDEEELDFYNRICKGEELSEDEIRELIDCYTIDESASDELDRWTQSISTIIKLCGDTFEVDWGKGLAEIS